MKSKTCSKCCIEKELCYFVKDKRRESGVRSLCLECENKRVKSCYEKDKKSKIEKQKKYTEKNINKVKDYQKEYRLKNKEKLSSYIKKYRNENRSDLNQKETLRKKKDILYKLKHIVRNRLYQYLKSKNKKKKNKTFEIVGCSVEELKIHIENLFVDGMSWNKMGKEIHIDHIIPLSSAKTEKDLFQLCHYKNLQPLWAEENLKKSNKVI